MHISFSLPGLILQSSFPFHLPGLGTFASTGPPFCRSFSFFHFPRFGLGATTFASLRVHHRRWNGSPMAKGNDIKTFIISIYTNEFICLCLNVFLCVSLSVSFSVSLSVSLSLSLSLSLSISPLSQGKYLYV